MQQCAYAGEGLRRGKVFGLQFGGFGEKVFAREGELSPFLEDAAGLLDGACHVSKVYWFCSSVFVDAS